MRTTHLSLVTIVAMIMITMTSMAQSNRLDSLGRVYDDIQKRAQVLQLEYDSIYRIIAQCKTDEERIFYHAEINKLDKKTQKLGQQTNKVHREIEVEKARIEQQKREAYLAQKQAELLLYGLSAILGMFAIILFDSGIWKALSFLLMIIAAVGIGYRNFIKEKDT